MTQSAPTMDQNPLNESQMTLMEHLLELRTRLIWTAVSLLLGFLVSLIFGRQLLEIILQPLRDAGAEAQALAPTDTITTLFKVCFTAGAALAMPVIVYQLIAFMSPGLYPHEKRGLLLTLPGVMILFGIGVAFSYYVLLPVAVQFLQEFLGGIVRQDWSIDRYVAFFTRVIFWIGVAFETPLVVAFLSRIGLVSGPTLLRVWRQAIVVMSIVAAAITPTIDPVNMAVVMGPLIILYFISVGLAYLLYRPREVRDFSQ